MPLALTWPWPCISALSWLPVCRITSQPFLEGPLRVCQTRSQVPATFCAAGTAAAAGAEATASGTAAARARTSERSDGLVADPLRLALALGRGEFLELLLAHRFDHLLRRALELALRRIAALGRQSGAGRFLLRL